MYSLLIQYTQCYYTFAEKDDCAGEHELQMYLKGGHVYVSAFSLEALHLPG